MRPIDVVPKHRVPKLRPVDISNTEATVSIVKEKPFSTIKHFKMVAIQKFIRWNIDSLIDGWL